MSGAFALAAAGLGACGGTTASDVRSVEPEKVGELAEPVATTLPNVATPTTEAKSANSCVASLTLPQKVGQLLVVLTSNPSKVTAFAASGQIGGVGLLTDQDAGVQASIAQGTAAAKIPLAVGSDEEGGTVQRLKAVLGPLPAARDSARDMSSSAVGTMWKEYATRMAGLGLTMNFGPTIDVGYGIAIKSRAFSDQTAVVTEYGLAALTGTNAGGIIPVVKHWPGLGSGSADPHGKLSIVGTKSVLQGKDFPPFDAAIKAGVQAVMVTHVNIPDVTNGQPASLSPAAIKILREEQGFKGVIMTDSLGMGAVTNLYDQSEAAELAIVAGNDVLLLNGAEAVEPAFNRLVDAVQKGRITEQRIDESLERWFRMKGVTTCPAATSAAPAAQSGTDGAVTASSGAVRDPNGLSGAVGAVATAPSTAVTAATAPVTLSTTTTINLRPSQG